MLCKGMIGTLICYAGSASEASIGSKPIGSELAGHMCMVGGESQGSLPDLGKAILNPNSER